MYRCAVAFEEAGDVGARSRRHLVGTCGTPGTFCAVLAVCTRRAVCACRTLRAAREDEVEHCCGGRAAVGHPRRGARVGGRDGADCDRRRRARGTLRALRTVCAGVTRVAFRALRTRVALRTPGAFRTDVALLAGSTICAGGTGIALRALRAADVHGVRVGQGLIVRPGEVAGRVHGGREGCAVLAGGAGGALRTRITLWTGFALCALERAIVHPSVRGAVDVDVVGFRRAYAVGVTCGRRLHSGLQGFERVVVVQHRQTFAGFALWALRTLDTLLALFALDALLTLDALLALVAAGDSDHELRGLRRTVVDYACVGAGFAGDHLLNLKRTRGALDALLALRAGCAGVTGRALDALRALGDRELKHRCVRRAGVFHLRLRAGRAGDHVANLDGSREAGLALGAGGSRCADLAAGDAEVEHRVFLRAGVGHRSLRAGVQRGHRANLDRAGRALRAGVAGRALDALRDTQLDLQALCFRDRSGGRRLRARRQRVGRDGDIIDRVAENKDVVDGLAHLVEPRLHGIRRSIRVRQHGRLHDHLPNIGLKHRRRIARALCEHKLHAHRAFQLHCPSGHRYSQRSAFRELYSVHGECHARAQAEIQRRHKPGRLFRLCFWCVLQRRGHSRGINGELHRILLSRPTEDVRRYAHAIG